ncbi:MAG: LLM class flavin-dependent oxidoreductase [Proteobacteria bacterium]|nr:LLM class flavin-dependent oxidoreductase [Pseudomonadota bacterium]
MYSPRKRFGAFIAPFHPTHENPTAALHRDLELVEFLDRLGYEEAWIGEHHSAGYEIIASPEVFIAGAAERTRHIRLGTGVSSLPYHHPLMLADRIMQLDHQTRGRVMFGVGPGALPSDAFMMGIEVAKQRDMMDEAIGVLVPLLRGETVSHSSEWFELREARLQLTPYTRPHVEIAVASQVSPAGARAAGKHGLSLLSIGATSTGGFNALATNWQICTDKAEEYGQTVDREGWRLVGPMHVAETREQARKNVAFGLRDWLRYFQEVAALPLAPPGNLDEAVDALIGSGLAVIGDPDDAAAQLARLEEQSGGFGCFLHMAHNWADFEATKRSYELFARYVAPRFQQGNTGRENSMEWAAENRPAFIGAVTQAIGNELQKHNKEMVEKKKPTGEAA